MRVALLVFALTEAVGPVAKVIQLLDELAQKVTTDGQNELNEFGEFSEWCSTERNDKDDSISASKRSINDLTATAEASAAAIEELGTKVTELSTAISANEEDLAAATKLRETEKGQFDVTNSELTETVDTLIRAQSVLAKHSEQASLLQVQQSLGEVAASLTQIVQAAWVNTDQKEIIQGFLQKDTHDDDWSLALTQQPQASTSAYDSHGGGILETLADLQEKAEAAQSEARKEETKAQHAFKMLASSLEAELKAQTKQMDDAKKSSAAHQEAQSEAEGDLSSTQASLADDQTALEATKATCQDKAQEWEASQRSRAEELQALAKAKEVLVGVGSSDASFVQLRAATNTRGLLSVNKDSAIVYLQKLAKHLNSLTLAQVAGQLSADPFGKVKAMIEDMVTKLLSEASAEADRKSWCDAEQAKTVTAQDDKAAKLEVADTRIEKAESTSAELERAINHLNKEIAAMDAGMSEATKLRQEEHANYKTAVKDYSEGQQATASAIQVLRNYYESGDSFIQSSAGKESGVAHSIIGLLEVAESDFSRMEADSRASESAAQSKYDEMSNQHKVSRAGKAAEANAKMAEEKRFESDAGNYKMDRQGLQKESDAINTYGEKLKPECEVKVPSYEERKDRRKAELDGLQNALAILDGRALALVETGHSLSRTSRFLSA